MYVSKRTIRFILATYLAGLLMIAFSGLWESLHKTYAFGEVLYTGVMTFIVVACIALGIYLYKKPLKIGK